MPLSKSEIGKLLKIEEIVYIATTKKDGSPHVVPIWFVYRNGRIYFETHLPTVKYRNIQRSPKVALCFGGKDTLIIEGTAREYKTEEELGFSFREEFRKKYKKAYEDSYITEKTRFFEVIPAKQISWHYWPTWD